jgi:hypothetical protein
MPHKLATTDQMRHGDALSSLGRKRQKLCRQFRGERVCIMRKQPLAGFLQNKLKQHTTL